MISELKRDTSHISALITKQEPLQISILLVLSVSHTSRLETDKLQLIFNSEPQQSISLTFSLHASRLGIVTEQFSSPILILVVESQHLILLTLNVSHTSRLETDKLQLIFNSEPQQSISLTFSLHASRLGIVTEQFSSPIVILVVESQHLILLTLNVSHTSRLETDKLQLIFNSEPQQSISLTFSLHASRLGIVTEQFSSPILILVVESQHLILLTLNVSHTSRLETDKLQLIFNSEPQQSISLTFSLHASRLGIVTEQFSSPIVI